MCVKILLKMVNECCCCVYNIVKLYCIFVFLFFLLDFYYKESSLVISIVGSFKILV